MLPEIYPGMNNDIIKLDNHFVLENQDLEIIVYGDDGLRHMKNILSVKLKINVV